MKILIVGGDGMLGHQCLRQWNARHEVYITLHNGIPGYTAPGLFKHERTFQNIDVRSAERILSCAENLKPEVIVNAVGLVKQRPLAKDSVASLEINALFPHRLADMANTIGARVIHFSTDCVFSGQKGHYTEKDSPDPEDLYGRTKLLGELHYSNCITLRTSIVGRELSRKAGLLEWFLAQRGSAQGFRHAIYSGFTTLEMARIVERIITNYSNVSGLWHVSSEPISKYNLLGLVRKHFDLETVIVPDDTFVCNRSLDSDRFRSAFGYSPPTWNDMVAELAQDDKFYR